MIKIILVTLFTFISIFLAIIGNKNSSFSSIVKYIIAILYSIFIISYAMNKYDIVVMFMTFILYLIIVILSKLIPIIAINQYSGNGKFKENFWNKLFVLVISPDYYITYLYKNYFDLKDENRRTIIQSYNIINIVITLLLLIIAIFTRNCCFCYISYFIKYRIISRTFEITASFVLDVMDKTKQSNLKPSDRIALACLSVIEVIGLSTTKCIYTSNSINDALLDGLYNAFSLNNKSLLDFMCYISVFALMGIVITTYISNGDKSKEK